MERDNMRTYKLPDGVVVKLGDIPVEIVLGFGRMDPDNHRILEERMNCRLRPAEVNSDYNASIEGVDMVALDDGPPEQYLDDEPGPDGMPPPQFAQQAPPMQVVPQMAGMPPMMAMPQPQPPQPSPAKMAESRHLRQTAARLNVAQSTINMFIQLRHHQVQAAAEKGEVDGNGEPYEGENWKMGDRSKKPQPIFTLTEAERRLYDVALDHVSNFIENGYPALPPGDPGVLNEGRD